MLERKPMSTCASTFAPSNSVTIRVFEMQLTDTSSFYDFRFRSLQASPSPSVVRTSPKKLHSHSRLSAFRPQTTCRARFAAQNSCLRSLSPLSQSLLRRQAHTLDLVLLMFCCDRAHPQLSAELRRVRVVESPRADSFFVHVSCCRQFARARV